MNSPKLTKACLILTLMTGGAMAQTVHLNQNVNADTIANAVSANGSAIVTTGPGQFERFVRDESQCASNEEAMPRYSPSGAYLGQVCEDKSLAGGD